MKKTAGIYVEILMHVPMDVLWQHTQEPALHEQWDLRFTSITYLARRPDETTQRFEYATQIVPGMRIVGEGETIATRTLPDGSRTSSLRFRSDNVFSLIREGSGYWKYVPVTNGIRFFTWYDYTTRWGWLGHVIDSLVFRPMMGWATAWSFDRLRLWIENGVTPARSIERTRKRLLTFGLWYGHREVPHAARCLRVAPEASE